MLFVCPFPVSTSGLSGGGILFILKPEYNNNRQNFKTTCGAREEEISQRNIKTRRKTKTEKILF